MIIDEEYRGKGLGTKFLKDVCKAIKKEKCKELHITSNFTRKKAHKFYEGLGFKKTAYYFWKVL